MNLKHLNSVIAINKSNVNARYLGESESTTIYGTPSTFSNTLNLSFKSGSYFSLLDNLLNKQVVVLGSEIAQELFPDGNAIGKKN